MPRAVDSLQAWSIIVLRHCSRPAESLTLPSYTHKTTHTHLNTLSLLSKKNPPCRLLCYSQKGWYYSVCTGPIYTFCIFYSSCTCSVIPLSVWFCCASGVMYAEVGKSTVLPPRATHSHIVSLWPLLFCMLTMDQINEVSTHFIWFIFTNVEMLQLATQFKLFMSGLC